MTTYRKFAAFARDGRGGLGISEVPADGFCISAFLIIRDADNPRDVLMGQINPNANWDHIGALTPDRIEAHSKGWMLPSCHLLYGESPSDAALRIAREQLGFDAEGLHLSEPRVYSEVYAPKRHPERKEHWDLQFLFEARMRRGELSGTNMPNVWRKLEFVDIDSVSKNEIARSHEDILARIE
jgi:ADP-ribose pyrophosphatase YjhB (NUDIX family)